MATWPRITEITEITDIIDITDIFDIIEITMKYLNKKFSKAMAGHRVATHLRQAPTHGLTSPSTKSKYELVSDSLEDK